MQTSWRRGSEIAGVCDNQIQTARKSLILKRPVVSERSESNGEMSEWLKEHAWKACVGETLPWVRIPLSPPISWFVRANEQVEWLLQHVVAFVTLHNGS